MRSIKSTDRREPVVVYFDIELDDMGLTPYEYRAYGRIARRASGGQRACTESLDSMAAGCQMSRRTLINAIKGLIQRRMIERESKIGDTSTYYLTDKSYWVGGSSDAQEVDQTFAGGGAPRAQGVVQEMPTPGAGDAQGVVHHVPTKNTREEDKKKTREEKSPATSSPSKITTPVDDLGDLLEDAYPGHATNWKTMRELRDLVNRVNGQREDILAFTGWLQRKYPKKANSPFAFKDLFPEMVKEINATKPKGATSHCEECNNGWILINDTARRCQCQTALVTA